MKSLRRTQFLLVFGWLLLSLVLAYWQLPFYIALFLSDYMTRYFPWVVA